MTYQDPVDRIVSLLRDKFRQGEIVAVFDGDPEYIPADYLPAVCVVQTNDTNDSGDSGSDDVTAEIQIRVILNKKDDWNDITVDKQFTDTKLRQIVEARDPSTGMYLPGTLKHMLRSELQLDPGSFVKRDMQFSMDTVVRVNGVDDDQMTREGTLTVNIAYPVNIDNMT